LPRDACEPGRQHDAGGNRQAFSVGHHGRAGRKDLSRHVVAREAADAEDAGATRRKLGSYVSSLAWQHVLSGLRVGWSPEQIADRLKTGHPGLRACEALPSTAQPSPRLYRRAGRACLEARLRKANPAESYQPGLAVLDVVEGSARASASSWPDTGKYVLANGDSA